MTFQAALFVAAVVSVFLIFAAVLGSVDLYTRRARTQRVGSVRDHTKPR